MRLKQIMLQAQGATIFEHPEIREALELSDEKAKALKARFEKVRNDMAADAKAGRISRQDANKQWTALGFGVPEQVRALLNEQQRRTIRDLLGEPFTFN